jgi:hypothetical protein
VSSVYIDTSCPLQNLFVLEASIEDERGGQFYWWRKPGCPEKTTDLSQVTDVNCMKKNQLFDLLDKGQNQSDLSLERDTWSCPNTYKYKYKGTRT